MAKRKPDPSKRQDAAVRYRARLEAKQSALAETQAARWSPGLRDRLDLGFARLLHTATAPTTRASRKAVYRASRAVVGAARAKDAVTFRRANDELQKVWREARGNRTATPRRRR